MMIRTGGHVPVGEWHAVDSKLVHRVESDGGRVQFNDGLEWDQMARDRWEISPNDPLSAVASCEPVLELLRKDWKIKVQTQSEMRCDATQFYTTNTVVVREVESTVFEWKWENAFRREGC